MAGLEGVVETLNNARIKASLWVDGSFLTQKIDPEDADVLLCVPCASWQAMTPEQQAAIDWFQNRDRWATHRCDTYRTVEFPVGHPSYPRWEWLRAYWIRQYGFSRTDEVKGIAVVGLTGGTP
jgi:hypothetical protein